MYVLTNLFLKFSLTFFDNSYCTTSICIILYDILGLCIQENTHNFCPCLYLHLILWISSARLSARFDNELAIDLAVSIFFFCYGKIWLLHFLPLFFQFFSNLFLFWSYKGFAFFTISPRQLNYPSDSFAIPFTTKW